MVIIDYVIKGQLKVDDDCYEFEDGMTDKEKQDKVDAIEDDTDDAAIREDSLENGKVERSISIV